MGRVVAQGGVTTVEVEVGVKVVGHFQAGFFGPGKGGAVGQQLGFERAPAGFGRRGLVGEVVFAVQVQVPVGEYGEGRERGQRSRLLLGRQPDQVLGKV